MDLRNTKYRTRPTSDHEPSARITEWTIEIPCTWGSIYLHGRGLLQAHVVCDSSRSARMQEKKHLSHVPSARIHQRGEEEFTYIFATKDLDKAAEVMGAYRKRDLSDEDKKKLADRLQASRTIRQEVKR